MSVTSQTVVSPVVIVGDGVEMSTVQLGTDVGTGVKVGAGVRVAVGVEVGNGVGVLVGVEGRGVAVGGTGVLVGVGV